MQSASPNPQDGVTPVELKIEKIVWVKNPQNRVAIKLIKKLYFKIPTTKWQRGSFQTVKEILNMILKKENASRTTHTIVPIPTNMPPM